VNGRVRCLAVVRAHARTRGAALVCSLLLMMAAMLVAVSISRTVFAAIASAGAERERSLAWETAEAALRDAERDIAGSADPARAAQFTEAGAAGFVDGCGRGGAGRGLCSATSPPAWQVLDLAEAGNPALVPYGYFTGASIGGGTGRGLLPAQPPAYLIERIAPPGAGASLGNFYRITAIGFGSNAAVRVVLQSVYRKPAPPGGAPPGSADTPPGEAAPGGAGPPGGEGVPGWPGVQEPAAPDPPAGGQGAEPGTGSDAATPPAQLPAGRIGWREIANWPRLHAEAVQ
jgi:type IV pilus assembly protein PilX